MSTENQMLKFISEAKKGNRRAFQELYDATWRGVYFTLLKRLKDEQDALDVLQSTYIKAFANIHTLENDASYGPWLNRIAYNLSMDYLREKSKEPTFTNLEDSTEYLEEEDNDFIPEAAMEKKEVKQLVIDVINSLPEQQKTAVLLFYYEGLSAKEIAEITDSSETKVFKKLFHARRAMKERFLELQRKGVTLFNMSVFSSINDILREEEVRCVSSEIGSLAWKAISSELFTGTAAVGGVATLKINAVRVAVMKSAAALTAAAAVASIAYNQYIKMNQNQDIVADSPVAFSTSALEYVAEEPTPTRAIEQQDTSRATPAPTPTPDANHQQASGLDSATELPSIENSSERQYESELGIVGNPVTDSNVASGYLPRETVTTTPVTTTPVATTPTTDVPVADTPAPTVIETDAPEDNAPVIDNFNYMVEANLEQGYMTLPPTQVPASPIAPPPTSTSTPRPTTERDFAPEESHAPPTITEMPPIRENISLVLGVNQITDPYAIAEHISESSGGFLNPEDFDLDELSYLYDGEVSGLYSFQVETKRQNTPVIINVTISVVDTKTPVVYVQNRRVQYPRGAAVSLSQILSDAGFSAWDNSADNIQPVVTGYEEINWKTPNEYALRVTVVDSAGNRAPKKIIIVRVY